MSGEVEIVPAGPCHAEVVAALMTRCVPEAWSPGSAATILALPNAKGWLAFAGTEPVGYAVAQRADDEVELQSIGVVAEARRRGVGARLHAAVVAFSRGAGRIVLEVAADNTRGRSFYAALGYRIVGRRRDYYRRNAGTADAVLMEVRPTSA